MLKCLKRSWKKTVDAVVTTATLSGLVRCAPLLLYYAAHDARGRVKTVGSDFNIGPIAIMMQLDSPLRRKIDLALIPLRENGTYHQIYDKWFGGPQDDLN